MLKPLPTLYAKVSAKSLAVFFADALLRQTEKFWICLSILLLTYLAPEFWSCPIVGMIFRFQLTLSPRTDLLIGDTSNIMHFMQKVCIHFTLDNVLQFCLSSLRSLLFYVLGTLMVFSGPWKCRDCKLVGISSPYSSLWLIYFPVAKMSKAQ